MVTTCISAFAGLLVITCCIAVGEASSASTDSLSLVSLQATTTEIVPWINTTEVTFNCRTTRNFLALASNHSIISLVLARDVGLIDPLQDIASITADYPSRNMDGLRGMNTEVSGHIGDKGHASLSVTIKHPNQLAGDYRCTLVEYDASGRPQSHIADITVTSLPKYKNHFYYISPSSKLSHPEANEKCHKLGGYLVEINDEYERNFIDSAIMEKMCNSSIIGGGSGYPGTIVTCKERYMRLGAKYDNVSGSWKFMTSGGQMDNVADSIYTGYLRDKMNASISSNPQNSCLYDLHEDRSLNFQFMQYYTAGCDWEGPAAWMCEIPEPAAATSIDVVG